MPVYQSTLTIIIASCGGWLIARFFLWILFGPESPNKIIGFKRTGILPLLQPKIAKNVAAAIVQKYLSAQVISKKVSNPDLMLQLKPEMEAQVDQFLKDKLPEAFPLLSKFMGEKTLIKFKEAFLTEVEIIFPAMLSSYAEKMLQDVKPEQLIEEKINSISIKDIKLYFYTYAKKQIILFQLAGLLAGALVGVIQVLVLKYI